MTIKHMKIHNMDNNIRLRSMEYSLQLIYLSVAILNPSPIFHIINTVRTKAAVIDTR